MLFEHEKEAIDKGLKILWIIWAAIMGSLLIYVFICYQFGEEMRGIVSQDFPIPLPRNILYGITIVTLFFTHFLKKLMLAGASGDSMPRSVESDKHSRSPESIAKYTAALVVSFALSESIGIYGLTLYLLGDGFQTLYTFVGISALAIYFHRPKREELETLAVAMQSGQTTGLQPETGT